MSAPLTPLVELTERLLKVSAQAAILILLVLLVKAVMGRRLPPRVSYALWLIVVVRLLLPVSLESGFSIFNLSTSTPARVFRAGGEESIASAVNAGAKRASAPETTSGSPTVPTPTARAAAEKFEASSAKVPASGTVASIKAGQPARRVVGAGKPFPWPQVLALMWLAGVVLLLARIIWIPLRLNAALARHETATSPAIFEILEESKRLSGVNQVLPIVQSRAVESPALLGFIRPWLLLPEGLVEKFTAQELRLVFLHELAHLKRRDIAVNWLATLLQIVHWPNPLVWIAFARMRADREVACDELALSFAREGESPAYGHAIIKLLEGFRRPAALPGLVGILEDQQHMQRRITMIAQFKRMTGWSASAAGLVLALGLVTLTDAQTEKTATRFTTPMAGAGAKTLVSGTGSEPRGVLSPDETTVAYSVATGSKPARYDIGIRDLRTGVTSVVAADPGRNGEGNPGRFVWSRDSKSIAYTFDWSADGSWRSPEYSLRIVSRGGGTPKVVFQQRDEWFVPSDWSPDGQSLVGVWNQDKVADKPLLLATVAVATGKLRTIGPALVHARYSPDGKFITGERSSGGNRDVYVVSADGARLTRLTDEPMEDGMPTFSADGRFVVFSSNRRGTWDLWATRVEEGQPVGAAFLVKYDFGNHAKWVTDTGKLAYRIAGTGADVYQVSAEQTAPAGAAGVRQVTRAYSGRNFAPMWSPDGRKIAYLRNAGVSESANALCVQSVADGDEQVFDPGLARCNRMFWSPDSQTIGIFGVAHGRSGGWGLYLFSLSARKVVAEHIQSAKPGWPLGFSADGREFIFADLDRKERVAVGIETKAQRSISVAAELALITKVGWEFNFADEEKLVTYVRKEGKEQQLIVAGSDNANPRVVARASQSGGIMSPRWSPDHTKVAYYSTRVLEGNGRHQLRICAADGSWDRLVETGPLYVWNATIPLSWSPDGTRLVLTLNQEAVGEIGVLENFLPPEKLAAK